MRAANVAVIVATFGTTNWEIDGDMAVQKLRDQTIKPGRTLLTMREHRLYMTLSEVRNSAVESLSKDTTYDDIGWLVFLDASDELDPHFVETLTSYEGDADILQVSVRGFREEGLATREWLEPEPVFHAKKFPLIRQNYLTIASPVRRETFLDVRGFDEWPVLEDWAFWLKCEKAGAKFGELPEACYYINDAHERNENINADAVAREIRAQYQ